jgi:hypothetical protein
MSDPVTVRGYRPSRRVPSEEGSEERERVRLANLERYMLRARAGLPIFDEAGHGAASSGRGIWRTSSSV